MSNQKKKLNPPNNQNTPTPTLTKLTSLQISSQKCSLAWEVLDAESHIYTASDLNLEKITHLTSLYMKVIEKLNCLQDPREPYFSYKMQKLMSEPYIIRFFNNQHEHKRNPLEERRKLLQQKIQQEAQRQNHKKIVQKTLQIQSEKEERVRSRIKNALEEADKKLEERIKKRTKNRLERSMELSPAASMQVLNSSAHTDERLNSSSKTIEVVIQEHNNDDIELFMTQEQRFNQLKRGLEEEEKEYRIARKVLGQFRNQEKRQ